MTPKTKIILTGAGALALLFLGAGAASAAQNPPAPGPGPGPQPPAPKPPNVPVLFLAKVIPNALNGMMARTEPSARGGNATLIAPEGVSPNDAFNGTTVKVLQTGLPDADGHTGGEWWKIVTPGGGVGYSRAVDPAGKQNFQRITGGAAVAGNFYPDRVRPVWQTRSAYRNRRSLLGGLV